MPRLGALRPRFRILAAVLGGLAAASLPNTSADAKDASIPDLSPAGTAWLRDGIDFAKPPEGPGPVTSDKAHPYVMRGTDKNGRDINMTQRVADLGNPVLKPWVVEALRKTNAIALSGTTPRTAMSSCWPAGVPLILAFQEPTYFIQTQKEVTIIYQRDHHVRHVYMNVPHSKKVTPSWYGESVGHYENGELVVDTIGLSDKTFVDFYGTPHSDKEHVVERYKVIDGGKTLQILFAVDDADAFNMKWSAIMNYKRVTSHLIESICAENNMDHFTGKLFPIPIAEKPDF
jgi:hypothetical protein